jgi:hypothetical protein
MSEPRDTFHVYKHSGHPEVGIVGDEILRSDQGFVSIEEASSATCALFPALHLVMLRGRYSGLIVAIRLPGQRCWTLLAEGSPPGGDRTDEAIRRQR